MMTCSMPAATASSTAYWMIGLSTSGSISLGCALVAGRKRVPQPAAGKTALRTRIEPRGCGDGSGCVGRASIPPGPGAARQPAGSSDRSKRRTASLKAAGRSRFARCVAPASRTRRGSRAARANDRGRQPERQVVRAVEDQRRPVVGREPRREPLARPGPAGPARPPRDQKPPATIGSAIARREPRPEEPRVEAVETRAVDRGPSPAASARYGSVVGPDGLGGGAGEDEAADPLGRARRELHRDVAAERQADHDRPAVRGSPHR